jgi:hypothetical protein
MAHEMPHVVLALAARADHTQPDAVIGAHYFGGAEPGHREADACGGKSGTSHKISPINFVRHNSFPLFILTFKRPTFLLAFNAQFISGSTKNFKHLSRRRGRGIKLAAWQVLISASTLSTQCASVMV